jgi:hypothetical protein
MDGRLADGIELEVGGFGSTEVRAKLLGKQL